MVYQNVISCVLVALLILFGAVTLEKLNWKMIRVWLPVNVIFVAMSVSGMYRVRWPLVRKSIIQIVMMHIILIFLPIEVQMVALKLGELDNSYRLNFALWILIRWLFKLILSFYAYFGIIVG